MTWFVAKHALKKAWLWTKSYWYIPAVLAYTLVLLFVFRRDSQEAGELLGTTIDSYEKQLAVLNKTHQDEIDKRDAALQKYQQVLSDLENKYAEEEKKLSESKKRTLKRIVEKYHDDTEGLAKEISKKFGATYVP